MWRNRWFRGLSTVVTASSALVLGMTSPAQAESCWHRELQTFRLAPHLARMQQLEAQQNWQGALVEAGHVLKIAPDHQVTRLRKLEILYEHQRYAEALRTAARIPQSSPYHIEAQYLTGLIAFEQADYTAARSDLMAALKSPALPDNLRARAQNLLEGMELAGSYVAVRRGERPLLAIPPPEPRLAPIKVAATPRPEFPPQSAASNQAPAAPQRPAPMQRAFEALAAGDAEGALAALDEARRAGAGPIVSLYEGYALKKLGRRAEARVAFLQAAQAPALETADRAKAWTEAGDIARQDDDLDGAAHAFRQALLLTPGDTALLRRLGYTEAARLDWRASVTALSQAAKEDGDVRLYQDIGYASLNADDRAGASHWFRRALDDGKTLSRPETLRLKQQVEWLENRVSLTLSSALRQNAVDGTRLNPLERSVLQSQGGLEVSVIPKGLGGQTARYAALTARMLWSYQPHDLAIAKRSWQAGVGLSIKPLAHDNLVLTAERLIAVGADARDDWMLRAAYSWSTGQDQPFQADPHLYPGARFYAGGGVIDPAHPDWLASADLQLGATWWGSERFSLWPHMVLAGNWQEDRYGHVTLVEGGPGITGTVAFDEGRYRAFKGALDLTLEYRFKLAGDSVGPSGLLLSLGLRH